jgi:hypothetical protein
MQLERLVRRRFGLAVLGFSAAYAGLLWALTKPNLLRDVVAWLWGKS